MRTPHRFSAFIFYFIRKQWPGFLGILITSLVWALNESFFPYFIKLLVDTISSLDSSQRDLYRALLPIVLWITGAWMAMEIASNLQKYLLRVVFPQFKSNIRMSVFDYVKGHSHEYFLKNFTGTIANKISELPKSCERILETVIVNIIAIMIAFFISVFLMGKVSLFFTFMMLTWLCLHIGTVLVYLRKINASSEAHSEAESALSGQISDCLSNILNVRLFARSKYERQFIRKYQTQEIETSRKASDIVRQVILIQAVLSFTLMILLIYTLIYGWSRKWVTVGDFSLIMMSSFGMMGMIWFVGSQISEIFREVGVVNASLSLIGESHSVKDIKGAKALQVMRGEICFDKVTFTFKRNDNFFKDKSLIINPGQKVGLVGFSGSGKTTFANLILRLYDVNKGKILIDGQDISRVTQESLRRNIAMIPQDPSLLHRSLLENIRYGRLEATDEEVIEASKQAYCHTFIMQFENGYQTVVGERGGKLSGGQKQRIAIARAILKRAPILILDEATSALDLDTEKRIQKSLRQLMNRSTTLVIAHRLSTLADMDRILVFDKGHIIEDGTVEELLINEGYFARMWQMKNHGFLPQEISSQKI